RQGPQPWIRTADTLAHTTPNRASLLPWLQLLWIILLTSDITTGDDYTFERKDWKDNDDKLVTGEAKLKVDFPMKNLTKYRTQTVRLRCEITGNPFPSYAWFKNNITISDSDKKDNSRVNARTTIWGSRLKISNAVPSDSATYTCKATNAKGEESTSGILIVRNEDPPPSEAKDGNTDYDYKETDTPIDRDGDFNGSYDKRTWVSTNENTPKEEKPPRVNPDKEKDREKDGFCQVYKGSTCSLYMGNSSVFVRSKKTLAEREEKFIAAFAVIGATPKLSDACQKYGIESLCYHAFPPCDETSSKPKPRQICKDECERLESDICKAEYLLAKRHDLIGETLLPKCHELKGPGTEEYQNCKRLGIPPGVYPQGRGEKKPYERPNDEPDVTCYMGTGTKYEGKVSFTRSGHTCRRWKDIPEFSAVGDHNYCRNPSKTEDSPWCFKDTRGKERELCEIPKCSENNHGDSNKLMYILIPSLTVPLTLGILLALVCFCQKSRISRVARPNGKQSQPVEMSPLNPKTASRAREFPMHNIRFLQELGEGAFGKVYKGELIGMFSESSVTKVAIKTLKENAQPKVQNDFRREVDLMTEMRHPNIVGLLGVCMKKEPMCMLFEYMAQGDLHEYLLSHSPHSDVTSGEDDSGTGAGHILEYNEMLHISTQIAAGMEYLASHHFVHRDLAARNILVAEGLTVKISDFGLSRDVYSSDYYRVQSKSLLPVRWMPPEAILYGKFTTDSDVWAFGVVLWEIFSYGLQPYYGFSNQEVIEMIRSRQILACPEECPARIYGLMVECWHEMPARRPAFREIHTRLRTWRAEVTPNAPWALSQSQSGHSSSTHQSTQSQPSHHSSTGPSNTTAVTGLTGSSNTSEPSPGQPMYPPPYTPYNHGGSLSPTPFGGGVPQQQQQHQQQMYPGNAMNSMQMHPQQYKANPYNGQNQYVQYPGGQPAVLNLQSGQIQMPRNMPQNVTQNFANGVGASTNGPSKVSPAGSVASSKSSNSASSTNNLGVTGGTAPRPGMAGQTTNSHTNQSASASQKQHPQMYIGGGASSVPTPPPVNIPECNGFNNFSHSGFSDQQRTSNI
ncbi:inactive tyrosine-protein kinase transmembrane receptor ROR1-like, partial [Physella acuta]|uniref:inactive tyrosine-protein kinase transmembrane receptor ROR1-like n=1 Tax=Physella acuta TaxID=109671 RepID=UPI0027DD20EB